MKGFNIWGLSVFYVPVAIILISSITYNIYDLFINRRRKKALRRKKFNAIIKNIETKRVA